MKKAVLEGLLFVVGEDGLTLEQIGDVLELDLDQSKELIMELKKDYEDESRGLRIDFLGNKFKITTKFEHKDYYQKLLENPETNTLSQAALETLAIIAYNEPVTRIQVDAIRGVGSVSIIRKLVAKGFVKEGGRSELPGRPILYETTNEFLDYFGLSTTDDLPSLEDIIPKEVQESDNVDLYASKYQDIMNTCTCGGIGRRGRLKICSGVIHVWVQVPSCAPFLFK